MQARRQAWIFVSSTFGDMEAELGQLESLVAPSLRRRGQQAGIEVRLINLYLPKTGVTSATLERRLQMIERARPFFLGLVGENYGPPLVSLDPHFLAAYPWIQAADDRSVLELEVEYGAFHQAAESARCLFCFRTGIAPAPRNALPMGRPDGEARLEALRTRIRASDHFVKRDYACLWNPHDTQPRLPASWVSELTEQLWGLIESTSIEPIVVSVPARPFVTMDPIPTLPKVSQAPATESVPPAPVAQTPTPEKTASPIKPRPIRRARPKSKVVEAVKSPAPPPAVSSQAADVPAPPDSSGQDSALRKPVVNPSTPPVEQQPGRTAQVTAFLPTGKPGQHAGTPPARVSPPPALDAVTARVAPPLEQPLPPLGRKPIRPREKMEDETDIYPPGFDPSNGLEPELPPVLPPRAEPLPVPAAPGDSPLPPTFRRIEKAEVDTGYLANGKAQEQHVIDTLERWLKSVNKLQREAHTSLAIHEQAAQSLCETIGLDLGMVLLRENDKWATVGLFQRDPRVSARCSTTLLKRILTEKKTIYQDLRMMKLPSDSLTELQAVVISPILDIHGEVSGALYGARRRRVLDKGGIELLEAQLVQLLGETIRAHLTMIQVTKQRAKLAQFFSQDLFQILEKQPSLLQGSLRPVTVLNAQLPGFEELLSKHPASVLCSMLCDIQEALSEQVIAHGGVIVNYPRYGVLAMWNAPVEQKDHACRACEAALDMQRQITHLNVKYRAKLPLGPLTLGVGLATGNAEVGNSGTSKRLIYGPRGPLVELACLLAKLTWRYRLPVLITKEAWKLLPSIYVTRRLGRIRIDAQAEPVVAYELFGKWATNEWKDLRQAYETALDLYQGRHWSAAVQQLMPQLSQLHNDPTPDVPLTKLLRRCWECLEVEPVDFSAAIDDVSGQID